MNGNLHETQAEAGNLKSGSTIPPVFVWLNLLHPWSSRWPRGSCQMGRACAYIHAVGLRAQIREVRFTFGGIQKRFPTADGRNPFRTTVRNPTEWFHPLVNANKHSMVSDVSLLYMLAILLSGWKTAHSMLEGETKDQGAAKPPSKCQCLDLRPEKLSLRALPSQRLKLMHGGPGTSMQNHASDFLGQVSRFSDFRSPIKCSPNVSILKIHSIAP